MSARVLEVPDHWDEEVDVVVAGSGGGALAAAVVGHDLHLQPVVLESSGQVGGGTALAAGGVWVPVSRHQREAGLADDPAAALQYLLAVCQGSDIPEAREIATAYVQNAAAMVDYLDEHTPLKFEVVPGFPDYRMDLAGSAYGRVLTVAPFDARSLGEWAGRVRRSVHYPPVSLTELERAGGTARAAQLGPLVAERMRDDVRAGGAAIVAALTRGCLDRKIDLRLDHRVVRLACDGTRVLGALVQHGGRETWVAARRGVVLATGGSDWNPESNRRGLLQPFDAPLTPPSNVGDGQRMGSELGLPLALIHESYWCPAYRLPQEYDGQPLYRPCVADRCLPHSLVVNRAGTRFADEALPYNDFVRGFAQAWDSRAYTFPNRPMYIVVDQQFRDRYPLCGVLPGQDSPAWIVSAPTLAQLAAQLDIDSAGLDATVERFNDAARTGIDPDFHRGEQTYGRYYGDGHHEPPLPNPCLGTLEEPPFYGLPLYVSTFGHKGGLLTNRHGQALDHDGNPVAGLYAVGNAAAGFHQNIGYTGGAIIGRSMTFGYLAARHIAASGQAG